MPTKALCGVGDGGGGGGVLVVGANVAHAVHVVDVMQADRPPGPMAHVETAPLVKQLPVCVALGLPDSVGMSVGIVQTSTGMHTVRPPLPLHCVVVVLKAHPPVLTGSVKSGGFLVGLGLQ
jgi:hypothetical protein